MVQADMISAAAIKSYSYLIIALASIVGSALVAPYISNSIAFTATNKSPLIPLASAVSLPFTVDHHVNIKEKAGNIVQIEEWNNDGERNCEMSCIYVKFQPGAASTSGLAFVSDSPLDLSGAKRVHFFLMGEKGGETVKVNLVGKKPTTGQNPDAPFKEKFSRSSGIITLTNDWKRYEMPLDGISLKDTTAPFALQLLKGKSTGNQAIYFKFIVYETDPVDQRFVLAANTTNSTASTTAPLAANTTNSTASLAPDNSTAQSTDAVKANNDTVDQVSGNAGNNNTSENGSIGTKRADRANNNNDVEASRPARTTSNSTAEVPAQEQTSNVPQDTTALQSNEENNSPPTATVAVDNVVAHPNDNIILDGTPSSDPDGDRITYDWRQSGGPTVDIIGGDTATPTITIPNLDDGDKVTINLEVSDSHGASDSASVVINIQTIQASAAEESGVSNVRDNVIDDDESPEDSTQEESGVTNDNGRSDD
ncbi:MAG: PKD domain-containing protein [Nitrososphaera sp.]